jgi:hypothetical protein
MTDYCKQKNLLFKLALFGLSFLCLFVWRFSPIFPDEIAVRLFSGHYIQDNGISQRLFHYCSANARQTPGLFVLPAFILSELDLHFSPIDIRFFPLVITWSMIVIAIILSIRLGDSYIAVFAITGLIGVAGSGLIMARAEYLQVLNVACCLGAIYFAESHTTQLSLRLGLSIVLLLSVLISLFGHIQGLLFLPLTLYMIFLLLGDSLGKSGIAVLMLGLFFYLTFVTINFHKFSCSEHPGIVKYVEDKVFNWDKFYSLDLGEWLQQEIKKYSLSFLYKGFYQINYLPGIAVSSSFQQSMLVLLNIAVVAVLLINFSLLLYVTLFGGGVLILSTLERTGLSKKSHQIQFSLETLTEVLLIALPVLFLFFYDSDRNFYRSFFINLLIAVVLAIALSRRFQNKVPRFAKIYCVLSLITVLASLFVNFCWFNERFAAGFQGPSMAVLQDWKAIKDDVEKLAADCGMDLTRGRIVLDDMTYDTLKSYPQVYPITYLHLSAILTNLKPNQVIEAIKPNYILARCDSFRSAEVDFQKSRNQLCCKNFFRVESPTHG